MPFLKNINFKWDSVEDKNVYPFNISAIKGIQSIKLDSNVTFFIGENGSGKSTLLEAIAINCGFGIVGGGKSNLLSGYEDKNSLDSIIKLSWMPKVKSGFFLRSETFYSFANYIDKLADDPFNIKQEVYGAYGGKSLHEQSHGEAFMSLFLNRFSHKGIYFLDEPEAALSPQRQLAFMRIIWELERKGIAQFIIATHSPILMAYPGAKIYNFDENPIKKVQFEETEHYKITKDFLNDKDRFLKHLLMY
ncbi:MAG: ATPase AAA [Peptococcaceae bacterium BICA1-8]|nr:MAG: ATPase AAA [Peptococcaceae bacterium BICA1-8]